MIKSLLLHPLYGGILVLAVIEDLQNDQNIGGQLDDSAHHKLRRLGLNTLIFTSEMKYIVFERSPTNHIPIIV